MYSLKRIHIVLLALVVFIGVTPIRLWAAPAAPITHTLTQADGQTFQAQQWGDENSHGWETIDGYTIIFDESLKSWTYAVPAAGGELMSSGMEVKQGVSPPSGLMGVEPHLRPSIRMEEHNLNAPTPDFSPRMRMVGETSALIPPATGTANIPVILANFSNTTTTYNTGNFNTLLFGTGNYSMKDFYQEVSYGAFSVSAGPNGIVGWYKASNTHDYYGQNVNGDDAWPGDLVYEAVRAADTAGFNFASYDRDGDCYVDVVMIVHQGTGEEASGTGTDIWSHRWSLNYAKSWVRSHYGEYTTQSNCVRGGKIKVNDYVIQPEVLQGGLQTMGVFAHEYGHALGLPDLYDTDGSSEGIGNWSLMAAGSWNRVSKTGDRPAHMDPWCKYKLGWVNPTKVNGRLTNEPITAANSTADVYQLLNGGPTAGGEYFLVENRQKAGFDAGLPNSGLLIWHIDEATTSNSKECYPGGPSCAAQHYHVALVQADNLWELEKRINRGSTGDSYPGSGNKTAFSGSTSPNSKLYNGTSSNVSVTGISGSAATMTATLSTSGDGRYPLTVSKAGTGSGTVTSSPAGINCGTDCSEEYDSGTTVTLTAAPASGSIFTGWSGVCNGTGTCQVTMSQSRTVTATFAIPYTLTVSKTGTGSGTVTSNPTGISCGTDCSEAYAGGTVVTLTATATSGSKFTGWGGACSGTTSTCTVTMSQARTVTATFAPVYTLTVSKAGAGSGTVISSPAGISCGTDCSEPYVSGTVVTLTATAASGSTFTGWSGACSGTTGTCTVTMSQARTVKATFVRVYTLTVSKTGTGSGTVASNPAGINCGSDCSEPYTSGTTVTLTATAASGSKFTGWGGACSGTGTCRVTMSQARTVTASFGKI
ncbi:MAG: M6 family metalloprotease domain-containing protein [Candidatus Competibacteraceae bacterium]